MSNIGPNFEDLEQEQDFTFQATSFLDKIVRKGAQDMLQAALEAEVQAFLERHQDKKTQAGLQRIVRNGQQPSRKILTGAGQLDIKRPRVRNRQPDPSNPATFSSAILPKYLRRSKNLDELIPWLYLKGVSTGDFSEALSALVGPAAKSLSKDTVVRLKDKWSQEYDLWSRRKLEGEAFVYVWADGVYFNIRLEEDRQCILVLLGVKLDGTKELLAVQPGYRESEQAWYEVLIDLKQRGLPEPPKLAIGDGALGFWAALRKVWPETKEQRCTVHKTRNVLDKLPKSVHTRAKAGLHEIFNAPTKEEAGKAFDSFVEKYQAKYPKATACLEKDREVLLTFFDFPAEHWIHIRSTNAVESVFATVRLRHRRTKGNGSARACLAMVFKLCQSASRNWRKIMGFRQLPDVIAGVQFRDGVRIAA